MSTLVDEQKLANFLAGAAHFTGWLEDQLVFGISSIEADPYNSLEDIASRLTDFQLPGPAAALRDWIGKIGKEENWTTEFLLELGYWHLQCALLHNPTSITQQQLDAVLVNFGQRIRQAELLSNEPTNLDTWTCVGIQEGENKNVYYRRTYWQGSLANHAAVQLAFNYGGPVAPSSTNVGTCGEFGVHSYPGGLPGRVIFPQKISLKKRSIDPFVHADWGAQQAYQRSLIATQPWRREMPVAINLGNVEKVADCLQLIDCHGVAFDLPLGENDKAAWQLWSIAACKPCKVFAILRQNNLELLSVSIAEELYQLES